MPIENADYFVRVMPFPTAIPGFVRSNSDGTYSLYLNSRNDPCKNIDVYEHELWHMIREDLYSEKSIYDIEDI